MEKLYKIYYNQPLTLDHLSDASELYKTTVGDIITKAQEFGFEAIALTDVNNMFGAIEFYEKATKANIKPILGVSLSVTGIDGGASKPYFITLLANPLFSYSLYKISKFSP